MVSCVICPIFEIEYHIFQGIQRGPEKGSRRVQKGFGGDREDESVLNHAVEGPMVIISSTRRISHTMPYANERCLCTNQLCTRLQLAFPTPRTALNVNASLKYFHKLRHGAVRCEYRRWLEIRRAYAPTLLFDYQYVLQLCQLSDRPTEWSVLRIASWRTWYVGSVLSIPRESIVRCNLTQQRNQAHRLCCLHPKYIFAGRHLADDRFQFVVMRNPRAQAVSTFYHEICTTTKP